MTEIMENTESVCPECFKESKIKTISAKVTEEKGKIWIEKECPKHGRFKSIVFEDSDLYKKWKEYQATGDGPENVTPLPFSDVELYPNHRSQSVLTNLFVTNRCNLRCSYCFANSGAEGFVYEPPLEKLREMMCQVREEKPVPSKAIQITGGEPTMRDDLFDIVEMAEEEGFTHIQLNTNGIKLAESIEYCRKLKVAGVNTIYMSFDGLTEESDPWAKQHKKALENLREADMGVVLVPTVIKGMNLDELGDIIKYGKENIDVVRGVNFQPISFTGRLTNTDEEKRKKKRVDYTAMIEKIEKELNGQIKKEDWYPVPSVYPISKLVESLKGERQVEFTANPSCGGATYVFIENDRITPITDFVDVSGLLDHIRKLSKKEEPLKNAKIAFSLLRNFSKFVDEDKAPQEFNVEKLIVNAIKGGEYQDLGKFHSKCLFLGTMWFQDAWNLDLERLKRCVIHYSTPEGIVPFCTYNGLNVGQKIREKHSMPIEEWEEKNGKKIEDDLWEKGPIS